jgi:hypothetical protein
MTYMLSEEEFAALKKKADEDVKARIDKLSADITSVFKSRGASLSDAYRDPNFSDLLHRIQTACQTALKSK